MLLNQNKPIMKRELYILMLLSFFVGHNFAQDTIVISNGNLFIGKITSVDHKELVIDHINQKTELKSEKIKLNRIAYCSNQSISYSAQPVLDNNEQGYFVNHTNIKLLAREKILTPKSHVSKELLPLHFMDILPIDGHRVIYSEVVQIESTDRDELYRRGRIWVTNTFKSANAVIQLEDPQNGIIICRGNTSIIHGFVAIKPETVTVNFRASIFVKENRYKYEVTDITLRYNSGNDIWKTDPVEYWFSSSREKNTKKLFESVNDAINGLIYSMKNGMTNQSQSNSDW